MTTTTATSPVLQGDCITRMKAMPSQSVNFILTDPPYLANYQSRDGRKVANDDNASWLRPAFAEMHRVLAQQSFCVSFYSWTKVDLFMAAWRAAGFRPVGHLVSPVPDHRWRAFCRLARIPLAQRRQAQAGAPGRRGYRPRLARRPDRARAL